MDTIKKGLLPTISDHPNFYKLLPTKRLAKVGHDKLTSATQTLLYSSYSADIRSKSHVHFATLLVHML